MMNLPELATTLGAWMLTYCIHSTAFLLVALGLAQLMRSSADARVESLLRVALVGGLFSASLQAGLGIQPLGGSLSLAAPQMATVPAAASPDLVAAVDSPPRQMSSSRPVATVPAGRGKVAREVPVTGTVALSSPTPSPLTTASAGLNLAWLLPTFGGLALLGLGLLVFGWLRLQRRLRDRETLVEGPAFEALQDLLREAEVRRPVRLSVSEQLPSPIAMGTFRAEICLPRRALSELAPEQLSGVLAHELAHLLWRDPLWLLVQALMQALFIFQPLNRVAGRRLRELAELRADAWAVAHTGNAPTLALSLTTIADWVRGSEPLHGSVAAATMDPGSALSRRVHSLLNAEPSTPRRPSFLRTVLLATLGLSLVAWLAPRVTSGRVHALAREELRPRVVAVQPAPTPRPSPSALSSRATPAALPAPTPPPAVYRLQTRPAPSAPPSAARPTALAAPDAPPAVYRIGSVPAPSPRATRSRSRTRTSVAPRASSRIYRVEEDGQVRTLVLAPGAEVSVAPTPGADDPLAADNPLWISLTAKEGEPTVYYLNGDDPAVSRSIAVDLVDGRVQNVRALTEDGELAVIELQAVDPNDVVGVHFSREESRSERQARARNQGRVRGANARAQRAWGRAMSERSRGRGSGEGSWIFDPSSDERGSFTGSVKGRFPSRTWDEDLSARTENLELIGRHGDQFVLLQSLDDDLRLFLAHDEGANLETSSPQGYELEPGQGLTLEVLQEGRLMRLEAEGGEARRFTVEGEARRLSRGVDNWSEVAVETAGEFLSVLRQRGQRRALEEELDDIEHRLEDIRAHEDREQLGALAAQTGRKRRLETQLSGVRDELARADAERAEEHHEKRIAELGAQLRRAGSRLLH